VFLQVLVWRQDMWWGGHDILRSNIGRTFYQRLDVRASVVDVWRSLVHFLCFDGGWSTAPGWWDINHQLLDLLTITRVVYSWLPVQDPYSIVVESSITSRWLLFVIHYACSHDAEVLAAEDVWDDRLSHCWCWVSVICAIVILYITWYPCFVHYIV